MRKTEIEMAREGEFLREYGKQYFVVASEALSIGRVKWNMVPVGKNGQNDITFYMTAEQMLNLCHEVLNGVFAKKLAADQGAYPKAYTYMTGEDGSLHLNIGGGKVGCRVQMQDAKAKPALNYTMAVSMEAMTNMARKYLLDTGMTPVAPGSYYASVVAAFEEGRKERSKFRKPNLEELGDVMSANGVIDEDVEDKLRNDAEVAQKPVAEPVAKQPESKPVEKSENNKADVQAVEEDFTVTVYGSKSLKNGFYTFAGKDSDGNEISLMFRKDDAERLNWFEKLENSAANGDATLKIRGEKKGKFILYKGPAKK